MKPKMFVFCLVVAFGIFRSLKHTVRDNALIEKKVLSSVGEYTVIMGGSSNEVRQKKAAYQSCYEQGFNDALDAMTLLNLELSLTHERKTFGEMSTLCRQKYGLKEKL